MASLKDPRGRKKGYLFIAIPVSWLDERPMAQLPHVAIGVYLRLYLLAARFNTGGALEDFNGPLDVKDIAFLLRCEQEELEESMDLLQDCSLLVRKESSWHIPSFSDEQINLDEQRERWRKTKSDQRRNQHAMDSDKEEELIPGENIPDPGENLDQGLKTEPIKEIKPDLYPKNKENKNLENKRIEGEKETTRGVLQDTISDTLPDELKSMVDKLFPVARSELFHEIYKQVSREYKTDDILAGIQAMVEVTVLHNFRSENLWNHFNKEMAIELCDPARRQVRLIEEHNLIEKKLTFSERMMHWAERMEDRYRSAK